MNICLYGASSTELDARYLDAAYDLGRRIAAGGHTMVYGGGAQGVMGAAARGVVDGGGALGGQLALQREHIPQRDGRFCEEYLLARQFQPPA